MGDGDKIGESYQSLDGGIGLEKKTSEKDSSDDQEGKLELKDGLLERSLDDSIFEDEEQKHDSTKKSNEMTTWKMFPDIYFSWAITLTV
jgi:hypothetical protein